MMSTKVSAHRRPHARWHALLTTAICTLAVSAKVASCQATTLQRASRTDLSTRLATVQGELASGKVEKKHLATLQSEVASISARLKSGDFQIGDRFIVTVTQDSARSDTVVVRDGLVISVGAMPDLSVAGVLRSELNERIGNHVSRFLKNTTVRTNLLTRMAILGAVRSPGYYYASPERPISELVMVAGGPAAQANLGELEIRRGKTVVLSAKESRKAIKEGRTLEQLDVQSGDEVNIALQKKFNWALILQLFSILSLVFFSIIQFASWYYSRQQ